MLKHCVKHLEARKGLFIISLWLVQSNISLNNSVQEERFRMWFPEMLCWLTEYWLPESLLLQSCSFSQCHCQNQVLESQVQGKKTWCLKEVFLSNAELHLLVKSRKHTSKIMFCCHFPVRFRALRWIGNFSHGRCQLKQWIGSLYWECFQRELQISSSWFGLRRNGDFDGVKAGFN